MPHSCRSRAMVSAFRWVDTKTMPGLSAYSTRRSTASRFSSLRANVSTRREMLGRSQKAPESRCGADSRGSIFCGDSFSAAWAMSMGSWRWLIMETNAVLCREYAAIASFGVPIGETFRFGETPKLAQMLLGGWKLDSGEPISVQPRRLGPLKYTVSGKAEPTHALHPGPRPGNHQFPRNPVRRGGRHRRH